MSLMDEKTFWEKQAETSRQSKSPNWADRYLEDREEMHIPSILVFGGTGGIGQAIAQYLPCKQLGSKDIDLFSKADIRRELETSQPQIVLNLVAINEDNPVHKHSINMIEKLTDVNVLGSNNILSTTLEWWRERGVQGRFIYMSSILSKKPLRGTGLYAATKAYNDALIKAAALENAKLGITVNSIQLGYFEGGLTNKVPPLVLDSVKAKIPVQRLGQGSDLYHALTFLINCPYVTGINLDLSGGLAIS